MVVAKKTHSFISLTYDKSIASLKASSPVYPLSVSSIIFFLKVIQYLLTSSSSSSRPFYLSFNHVFQKAVPMQDVTNPVSLPSFYCMYDVPFFFASFVSKIVINNLRLIGMNRNCLLISSGYCFVSILW
jgi:hypothetical protein